MSDEPDDYSNVRRPPHSVEAEQSVLGGLLLDNAAFDRVGDVLDASDFYAHGHRLVYGAIYGQLLIGRAVDVVSLFDALKSAGKDQECGGLTYLNQLAQCVPSAANIRRHAEIVRERSVLRAIIAMTDEAATQAFRTDAPGDVIDSLGTKLAQLGRKQIRQVPVLLRDVVTATVDHISEMNAGNVAPGWATGLPALDDATNGGPGPGKVVVLAARPSVGKSSFAQQLGLHFAGRDLPVLMLSQEMPNSEVGGRALANLGGVDYGRLQRGRLNDGEWADLARAVESAGALPFYTDDQAGLKLSDIRAKARSVTGLKVLILDYLQLSAGNGKGDNRNSEIEEISRGLKVLAKEMSVLVIVLSQLNRKVEERPNKEPELSDLRDSGAIEQDADIVLFLWPLRDLEEHVSKLVGCKVAKNRGGRLPKFALEFRGATQWWGESTEPVYPHKATGSSTKGYD